MIYILGLGSNIADREQNINIAIQAINCLPNCKIQIISRILETKPVGNTEQPFFLNCAIQIDCTFNPEELMDCCLVIEKNMGRIRNKKWEPRLIDIDILLWEKGEIQKSTITLPHPECHKRKFILQSLAEICPNWEHPIINKTMKQLYEEFI
jgi:2-amino-4-hydroxy-6-hydroxymethyldihydropteridine diphosphokinase